MSNTTFADLYEAAKKMPSPGAIFIKEVAELTHRSENTVRMWIWGRQQPDELTKDVIAKHFKVSADTLFPAMQDAEPQAI